MGNKKAYSEGRRGTHLVREKEKGYRLYSIDWSWLAEKKGREEMRPAAKSHGGGGKKSYHLLRVIKKTKKTVQENKRKDL